MNEQPLQSLRQYLTCPNPELKRGLPERPGKTNSSGFSWTRPYEFRKWNEFDAQSLKLMYGGKFGKLLDKCYPFHNFADLPRVPFCLIVDENSFERFLVKWTQSVVTEALEFAQKHDILESSSMVYMVSGGLAERTPQPVQKKKKGEKQSKVKRCYPDWAAVKFKKHSLRESQDDSTFETTHSLMPGDTKLSAKWRGANVCEGLCEDIPIHQIMPVIQIFNYCLSTGSRYGYLITDEELFVIRVRILQSSPREGGSSQETTFDQEDTDNSKFGGTIYRSRVIDEARERAIVEYKSIPWHPKEENELTINLSLFWLHILAAFDNTIQRHYDPLIDQKMSAMQESFSKEFTEQNPIITASFSENVSGMNLADRASSPDVGAYQASSQTSNKSNRKRPRQSGQPAGIRKKRPHHKSSQ